MNSLAARIVYAVVIMAAFLYAVHSLRGPRGVSAWMQKETEAQKLEERVSALARENEQKAIELEVVRKKRDQQELMIRDRLKLLRRDEKLYILENK